MTIFIPTPLRPYAGGDGTAEISAATIAEALDVGVLVLIKIREPINHALRFLRCSGVIEPYERPSVDTLAQDRKVALKGLGVERGGREIRVLGNIRFVPDRLVYGRSLSRRNRARFAEKTKG
jgi:hypothetical protein